MALKDELGKMIGPLPMGAWIAVVGGGLAYLYYTKSHPAAIDSTATADPTNTADTGVGLGGIPAGYTYTGDTSGDSGATGTPTITDNTQWATAAVNYLISVGYDAAQAQVAITVLLNGGTPTATQWTMISAALQHIGALPDPVTTTGNPPTGGTPAASSTFKVQTGTGHAVGTYYLTEAYQARNNKGQATGPKRAKGYAVRVIQWGEIGTTLYAQSVSYYYAAAVLTQTKATAHTTSKTSASKPKPKPKAKPKTPAKVTSPKVTKKTYTVKHNDNLSSIAAKYHISWQTLYNANKSKIGSNPNLIHPGLVLTIP